MENLSGSRIVVTGGAGFIGSTIIDQLLEQSVSEIIIIDNFIRGTKDNIVQALASGRVRLLEGDIRNSDLLKRTFEGIHYCFHMAALRISHCAAEPRHALEVMYDGAFNVMECCVEKNIKKIVLASTASIYGMADSFPTAEDHHPYNNRTLYGAAKIANEGMLRAFYDMCGLKYNALRFFNVYGPRMDVYGKYTEVMIRWYHLIREGKQPLIYGDGKQTMDFIYVEDVARAAIGALKSDIHDTVFNIASGVETSLEQLCYALLEVMGSKLKPQYIPIPDDRKRVEVLRRLADVSKARTQLGFEAEVSLKSGLEKLVHWLNARAD
jgi:UDP-glucose 4-epimerase